MVAKCQRLKTDCFLSFLEQVILVNFRQEILPFIPKEDDLKEEPDNDCSDILIVSELTAIAAHNEDANVALLGHT